MSTTEKDVSGREIAIEVTKRSREHGLRIAESVYTPELTIGSDKLPGMLEQFMWNEFYLGVWPPVREMNMLYEAGNDAIGQELDLVLALSDQIRDEVKHSKLFSRRIEEVGGNPNLMEYDPTPEQERLFRATTEHDSLLSLASALQLSAEPMLAAFFTTMINNEVVDERTRNVIHQAEIDEGNHINNGRQIVARYATTEEAENDIWEAHEKVADAMSGIYK